VNVLNFYLILSLVSPLFSWAGEINEIDCESALSPQKSYTRYFDATADRYLNLNQLKALFQLHDEARAAGVPIKVRNDEQASILSELLKSEVDVDRTFTTQQFHSVLQKAFYSMAYAFAEWRHAGHPTVPLEDLVQAATVGLFIALQEYHPGVGHIVSTLAWNRMKSEVDVVIASYEDDFSHNHMKWSNLSRLASALISDGQEIPSDLESPEGFTERSQVANILRKLADRTGVSSEGRIYLSMFFGIELINPVRLRYLPGDTDDVSIKEIAQRYGVAKNRVYNEITFSLRKMRHTSGLYLYQKVREAREKCQIKFDPQYGRTSTLLCDRNSYEKSLRDAIEHLTEVELTVGDASLLYDVAAAGF
jgi:hypothetical protein